MRRRPVKSFTLLELIVVMGILVLLSAVAIPAYSSLFSGRKTTLAANKLNGAVMEARSYAVSNKIYTGLVFLKEKVPNTTKDGFIRFRLAELYHDPEKPSSKYIWSRWANGSDFVLLPENTMIPDENKSFGTTSSDNSGSASGDGDMPDVDYGLLKQANLPADLTTSALTGAKCIIFRPNGQLASNEKSVIVQFVEANKYNGNASEAAALPLRIHWLSCKTKFMDPVTN